MGDGSQKKPKGMLIAALICFLIGLVGCGAAGYGAVQLVDIAKDVTDTTPMGAQTSFKAGNDGKALVLLSADAVCEGTDDSGNSIRFDTFSGNRNVNVNNESFDAFRTFDVVAGTRYRLTCGSQGAGDYTVVRLPAFFTGAGAIAAVGGFFGGGLFMLVAVILFIVGLIQRSSWKKRQAQLTQPYAPGQVPPPGSGYGPPGQQPPPLGGGPGAPPVGAPPPVQQPPFQQPPPQAPPPFQQPPPQQTPGNPPPPPPPGQGDPDLR